MACSSSCWPHMKPSSMNVQYPTSPQDSLSTTHNIPSHYNYSNTFLQDEQLHDHIHLVLEEELQDKSFTPPKWAALGAHNQLMDYNLEKSIDWLNCEAYDQFESKDALIKYYPSSISNSSSLFPPSYEHDNNCGFDQNGANSINATPIVHYNGGNSINVTPIHHHHGDNSTNVTPIHHHGAANSINVINPIHQHGADSSINDSPIAHPQTLKNPLETEPNPLDLALFEQELEMYGNVGGSTKLIDDQDMVDFKCLLAQGSERMSYRSIMYSDCAPSMFINQSTCTPAEGNYIIKAPSTCSRSSINNIFTPVNVGDDNQFSVRLSEGSPLERENTVVERDERAYYTSDDDINKVISMNLYSHPLSNMMIKATCCTPSMRRETARNSSCSDQEDSLSREERETKGSVKRESEYSRENYGRENREERGCKMRRDDQKMEIMGTAVSRESMGISVQQGRKRAREETYRRAGGGGGGGGGGGDDEQDDGVIHVRARRGQATDSHSLAERVRRERISQRMKLLQDLVPTCTKVLGKAAVLEEIINYVKSLQQQIEFLSMRLANFHYEKRFHI